MPLFLVLMQLNGVLLEVGQANAKISAAEFFDVNLGLFPTVKSFSPLIIVGY